MFRFMFTGVSSSFELLVWVPKYNPSNAAYNPFSPGRFRCVINSACSRHDKELRSRGKRDPRRKNPALLIMALIN